MHFQTGSELIVLVVVATSGLSGSSFHGTTSDTAPDDRCTRLVSRQAPARRMAAATAMHQRFTST